MLCVFDIAILQCGRSENQKERGIRKAWTGIKGPPSLLCRPSTPKMPTVPYPLLLLAFDADDPKHPDSASFWTWPEWQRISGLSAPPYDPNFNQKVPPTAAIPAQEHASLVSFIAKFRTIEAAKQASFVMKNASDSNQDGRSCWRRWVASRWKAWNLLGLVEKALKERGADPWTIMAEDNTRVVSDAINSDGGHTANIITSYQLKKRRTSTPTHLRSQLNSLGLTRWSTLPIQTASKPR